MSPLDDRDQATKEVLPEWFRRSAHLLSLAAGILLGVPVHLPGLSPLQLPALALLWWLVMAIARCGDAVWKTALSAGFGYAITRITGLMLPIPVLLVLMLGGSLFWMITGLVAVRLERVGPLRGALAMGGWLVLAEALFQMILPLFGTGQSFAVCWSPWGSWLPFVPLFGLPSLVFLLGMLSWLLAACARTPLDRPWNRLASMSLGIAIAFCPAAIALFWKPAGNPPLLRRVAVWGCPASSLEKGNITARFLIPAMSEAAAQGAGLIVFPELILQHSRPEKSLAALRLEAARLKLAVVVGWLEDGKSSANRLTIIGPDGQDLATYVKTNLVPLMENYDRVGDGIPATAEWKGIRLGAMVCQDDNFPGIPCVAASLTANLLVVPTFDWPGVHHMHFLNSRWRPLENGIPLARAAIGGHTALVAYDGRVLDSADTTEKPALVVGDVSVPASPSPYHRWGDWPVLGLSLAALVSALLRRKVVR